MAHHTELNIRTSRKQECVDVTDLIVRAVTDFGVDSGLCVLFVPHTTASIIANEHFDPNVAHDIVKSMGNLVPDNVQWNHPEENAPAHVKASLLSSSLSIPVVEGKLVIGRWQGLFLLEFDGPRTRQLHVTVIG
ncbi:MAG: secondary thiamine-phosphate synthase enzyme YjbQ [Armatimonadota bacterium]